MANFKNYLEIIIAIIGLASVIYRISKIEASIYQTIDNRDDILSEEIGEIKAQLLTHLAVCKEKEEWAEYLLNALDQKIEHKFNRLYQEIKELKG
jgi:muramidase (phage lysozyme)